MAPRHNVAPLLQRLCPEPSFRRAAAKTPLRRSQTPLQPLTCRTASLGSNQITAVAKTTKPNSTPAVPRRSALIKSPSAALLHPPRCFRSSSRGCSRSSVAALGRAAARQCSYTRRAASVLLHVAALGRAAARRCSVQPQVLPTQPLRHHAAAPPRRCCPDSRAAAKLSSTSPTRNRCLPTMLVAPLRRSCSAAFAPRRFSPLPHTPSLAAASSPRLPPHATAALQRRSDAVSHRRRKTRSDAVSYRRRKAHHFATAPVRTMAPPNANLRTPKQPPHPMQPLL